MASRDAEINKRQLENYSTLLISALKSTWNYFAQDVGGLFSYSGCSNVWFSPKEKVSSVKDVYIKKLNLGTMTSVFLTYVSFKDDW